MRIFRKIAFTDGGSAAVEFALILPMIMLLVAGLLDYGNVMTIRMRVNSAARVAVQYAAHYPAAAASITAAGTAATSDPNIVVGAPLFRCTCDNPWGVGVSGSSLSSCSSLSCVSAQATLRHHRYYYVTVSATENYTPLLPYNGLGAPIILTGTATIEVQ